MESIWDYIMRRKPVFLGYFALFLVSVLASCQFLNNTFSENTIPGPSIVQEANQNEQYGRVLSPEAVAALPAPETQENPLLAQEAQPAQEAILPALDPNPSPALSFVQVDIANPSLTQDSGAIDVPLTSTPQGASESASSAPRKVSILRTILAVLLAVAALTLAGFGLYQAYGYFAPYIDDYLRRNYH